jgi:hypothetical protein
MDLIISHLAKGFTARINEEIIEFNLSNSNFNNGEKFLSVT